MGSASNFCLLNYISKMQRGCTSTTAPMQVLLRRTKVETSIIGLKFGRWVVLEKLTSKPNKRNRSVWYLCRCECGIEKEVNGNSLKSGRNNSCGCLRRKEGNFTRLYHRYKNNAKISFNLSKEQFRKLVTGNCYYCGQEPSQIATRPHVKSTPFVYNGIDRLDNSVGYLTNNCVSACGNCNHMKGTLSPSEFINTCLSVVAYRKVPVGNAPIQISKEGDDQPFVTYDGLSKAMGFSETPRQDS